MRSARLLIVAILVACGAVRRDWPVVEIADADHLSCLVKSELRDQLASWLDRSR